MAYNLTWMDSANTLYDVATNTNTLTNGGVGIVLLLAVFFTVWMLVNPSDRVSAFIGASTATSLVASLLWFVGLIPYSYVIVPIVLVLVGVGIKFFGD